MACHQRLRTAHKKGRRRAWHAIISFRQYRRSDDIRRGMPSRPLDNTHGWMTSGVACHRHSWKSRMVGWRRARHVITAFGQNTRSDYVGRGMTSSPLDNTHGRTTSGLTCHYRFWTAHTVGLRRAWNDITALVLHTRSNDVWRGMQSSPFGSTHGRTKSGVA